MISLFLQPPFLSVESHVQDTEYYRLPANTIPRWIKFGKHVCNDVTLGTSCPIRVRMLFESLHGPIQFATFVSAPQTTTAPAYRMPQAACRIPHSAFRMPHAACRMPHPHAACRMPHAACRMPHAACRMPHAACRMPHAACRMPHSHIWNLSFKRHIVSLGPI